MPAKTERQVKHIADSEQKKHPGMSRKEAVSIGWATVNKKKKKKKRRTTKK